MSHQLTAVDGMGRVAGDLSTYGMNTLKHMHIAEDFLVAGGGVVDLIGGDCKVTQSVSPGQSVLVAKGRVYIPNSAYTVNNNSNTKYWRDTADAAETLAIAANSSGNPRIDLIQVRKTATAPGDTGVNCVYEVKQGSAGAIPVAPTVDNDAYALAYIAVANGFSSITNANITDLRTQAQLDASKLGGVGDRFIINGGCKVAQQSLIAPNISTSYQFGPVDRFAMKATGSAVSAGTITQDTASTLSVASYALKASGVTLTGSGIVYARYRMESKDAASYKNLVASLSLKVKHDVGSAINYVIYLRKANAVDDFSSTTDISNSGNISVANNTDTLIKYENVSLGDVSNGLEIEVQAVCGAISTKNFSFSEWQMNRGVIALTFQPRLYDEELRACQRYLRPVLIGGNYLFSGVNAKRVGTNTVSVDKLFDTPMRAIPTIINSMTSFVSANATSTGQYDFYDWQAAAFLGINSGIITIAFGYASPWGVSINFSNPANYTNGAIGNLTILEYFNCAIFANAEL